MTVSYEDRLRRLSERSVEKHFDAYADIAWDAPEHTIDPRDPRFALSDDHPLGASTWYRARPADERARIGLECLVQQMAVGAFFENVLSRGLLVLASRTDEQQPELRYALHEVIEECQHSLMFHEFVRRSGLRPAGVSGPKRWMADRVPGFAARSPELFFLFVLAGEEPIDRAQREALARGGLHPLVERIMRIHTTEEARHLCFARSYLERRAPALGALRRLQLTVRLPFMLRVMSSMMLEPPSAILRAHHAPHGVVKLTPGARAESVAGVRALAAKLGLIEGRAGELWRRLELVPAILQGAEARG